jgi:hypothetical protein
MAEVLPFPRIGELFVDARGGERTMRVSHHPEKNLVIVSIWAAGTCRATFQLRSTELLRLSDLLNGVTVDEDLPRAC